MFTVHHLTQSRSQRIVWLLELTNVEYQIVPYARDRETNLAPNELKKIHPLGAAPVLVHNDTILAESGAICEYILQQTSTTQDTSTQKSGLLPPREQQAYIDVQFWSHFAEGSFAPPLVASLVLSKVKVKAPWLIRPIAIKLADAIMGAYYGKVIARNLAFIENHLQSNTWFVGDSITLADVQMSFGMERVYNAGMISAFPTMCAYVERLLAEPSFQQAKRKIEDAEASLE